MAAPDIDGRILVGEPVDKTMAKLILGDEPAIEQSAKDQDVQPAGVIGNQQAVRLDGGSFEGDTSSDQPSRVPQEEHWPDGSASHPFGREMKRRVGKEQKD